MAKPNYKINVRDMIIGLLVLGLIATNYILYNVYTGQNITNTGSAQAWVQSEYEIGKLQTCINTRATSCDISTGQPMSDH